MAKTRKLQIPISIEDENTIKSVAKIYNVSAAEWVRNTIIRAAQRDLYDPTLTDSEVVLNKLSKLNAPIGSVKAMKLQSVKGRYK